MGQAVRIDKPYLIRYGFGVKCVVLLTREVEAWLQTCHPTKTERDQIIARFRYAFQLLREFGLAIGKPHIDHIEGWKNLWEVRVNHRSGTYRAFFGMATDGTVLLVAHGEMKKRNRFPVAVYQRASQKVEEAVRRYEKERGEESDKSRFVPAP